MEPTEVPVCCGVTWYHSVCGDSVALCPPIRETDSKQPEEKRPKDFTKDGKVCRLRTQEDSEDENNTWNGNSTQQM